MRSLNQIVLEGVLIINFDEILISTEAGAIAVELPAYVPRRKGMQDRWPFDYERQENKKKC